MWEVVGDKYMYLTHYVHLGGINRNDWLQEHMQWIVSQYGR